MKNKKGFTLIELLAVIVILAVIMVIAVPQILNVIESSKNSAADSSIKLVKDAIRSQVTTASMAGTSFEKTGECYLFDFENNNENVQNLSLKNKERIGGSIKYCNGKFEDDTLTFDGTSASTNKKSWILEEDNNSNGNADIGDLICIKTECFYVYSNDGTNIKALARYNLYVGGEYSSTYTEYGEEATGLQEENMRGAVTGQPKYNGTVLFSSDSQKGTNYSDYEGSVVEKYVNQYKTKLEGMGANIQNATLITNDELAELGCSTSGINCASDTVPEFIYYTSYWTRSISGTSQVWGVGSGKYSGNYNHNSCLLSTYFGVRPVITISVSEI